MTHRDLANPRTLLLSETHIRPSSHSHMRRNEASNLHQHVQNKSATAVQATVRASGSALFFPGQTPNPKLRAEPNARVLHVQPAVLSSIKAVSCCCCKCITFGNYDGLELQALVDKSNRDMNMIEQTCASLLSWGNIGCHRTSGMCSNCGKFSGFCQDLGPVRPGHTHGQQDRSFQSPCVHSTHWPLHASSIKGPTGPTLVNAITPPR